MQSSILGSLNYICPCFVHAMTKTKSVLRIHYPFFATKAYVAAYIAENT